MSILKGLKLFPIFLVILVSLVSLTTFPSNGYGDDWVFIYNNDNFILFYNSSTIKIDNKHYIIKVWTKQQLTEKGRKEYIDSHKHFPNINDIKIILSLNYINYKDNKITINHLTYYSNSGRLLKYFTYQNDNWLDIIPDTFGDEILKKIIKDYSIKR
jgi:hypothetical protein